MNDLIPALCITLGPVLVLAPVVYALRPQGGRHGSLRVRVPAWWTPYDARAREAIRHYASRKREPGLDARPVSPAGDRDLTGAFPVVRAA